MHASTGRQETWRPFDGGVHRITRRQRQVLELLAQNRTNGEIARALGISFDGAKWHVGQILERLGSDSRQEVAAWWRRSRHEVGDFAPAV